MRNVGFCPTPGAWVAVDRCGAVHDRQWLQSITQTRPEAVRTCGNSTVHDIMWKVYAATKLCGSCSEAIRKRQPALRLMHSVSSRRNIGSYEQYCCA